MYSNDGLPLQDIFAENAKSLLKRECFAIKRAFRMASLAREGLEISQFNQKV